MPDLTLADIERVLSRVHDPCSLAAGSPLPVTALGLVTGWAVDGGALRRDPRRSPDERQLGLANCCGAG